MDSQQVIIVVAPLADPHTPDSTEIRATCGHPAWISVTGRAAMQRNPLATTQCRACLTLTDAFSGEVAEIPGSIEAAASYLGISPDVLRSQFHNAVARHGGTVVPPD